MKGKAKLLNTNSILLPWVPEPQNLNERKLVRGKKREKEERRNEELSFLPYFFIFIIFWLWYPGYNIACLFRQLKTFATLVFFSNIISSFSSLA